MHQIKLLFLYPTAYALAGRVDIDFETEPLGHDTENKPVFLRDIWPTRQEIQVTFFNPKCIVFTGKDISFRAFSFTNEHKMQVFCSTY